MSKRPLKVIVTWDDAVSDTTAVVHWEFSAEAIKKIGEKCDLVRDRSTIGWLGYIDEEKVVLFHDSDADDELCNSTAILTGWITRVATVSGRVLFTREQLTPKPKKAKPPLRKQESPCD